jgi:predicted DNA-binding transcriptional regulator AlpA
MPDEIFVSYPELPNFGVPKYSRKHLLDMQRRGQFPRAIQLSPNRVAWRSSELARWCASRPTARAVAEEPADAAD